jgi:Xaa-Pro aminopeptidase
MRRSADIACAAHRRAVRSAAPGPDGIRGDGGHPALSSTAAAPDISYTRSSAAGRIPACCTTARTAGRCRTASCCLIDAGCEFDYYASDVTRTLPVGGRYSRRQRAIYEVVLEAHDAAIRKGPRGRALERAARGSRARDHAGPREARPPEGPAARARQGRRLPPVLHAPRRALARHGRA